MVSAISRWENGHRAPDVYYRRLLRLVFDLPDTALGFDEQPDVPAIVATERASPTALHVHTGPVDDALLRDLQALTDNYRRIDRRLGAHAVNQELSRHLDRMEALQHQVADAGARRRLAFLAGDVAALLGWQALDHGRGTEAWSRFRVAAHAAEEAEDAALHAFVVAEMAYVPLHGGRAHEALAIVEHALTIAGSRTAPGLRAWLTAVRAEALSGTGDERGSLNALDLAEQLLAASPAGEPPSPGMSYFDLSHLVRWRGQCLVELRRTDEASQVLVEALAAVDVSFVRARAGLMLDLATARAQAGDIDEACELAVRALWMARETNSYRYQQRVVAFRAALEPHASSLAVRRLDEAIEQR
jgi:tetratricopeptide (TPR) repeat protein